MEAFQVDHANAIEHYRRPTLDILDAADFVIAALFIAALGLIFAGVI